MRDDSQASPAAQPGRADQCPDASDDGPSRDGESVAGSGSQGQSSSTSPEATSRRKKKRRSKEKKRTNPGLVKKLAFVTHLLASLDSLVIVELSALYYMECSMFRFLLRAVGQYIYLTPKDEAFPFAMPARRMHVLAVFLPNLICVLLHTFGALPSGPEYFRGYQHGGVIIDFIGQMPAQSSIYYILVDLVILAMQTLMLVVHTEREKLRVALRTFKPALPELAQEMASAPTLEDLDAEERGVSRDPSSVGIDGTGDIELQSLAESREAGFRSDENLDGPKNDLIDTMNSGNAILGNYHILHGVRAAAADNESAAGHSLNTLGYGATLALIRSQQSATLRR